MCHVGLDVGINTTAPKLLMERAGLPLAAAGYATSLYFLCRTVGCFSGAFILARFSPKKFFAISAACLVLSVVGLLFFSNTIMIYICIGVLGFGNSNVFPIIFSQALEREPKHTNEVSGLMMMGIFGGAIIPLLMGVASDAVGAQFGAIVVAMVCAAYLMALATKLK
jgi:fucose permease